MLFFEQHDDIVQLKNIDSEKYFLVHKLVLIGKSAMLVFDDTKPWNEKLALYEYGVISSQNSINFSRIMII